MGFGKNNSFKLKYFHPIGHANSKAKKNLTQRRKGAKVKAKSGIPAKGEEPVWVKRMRAYRYASQLRRQSQAPTFLSPAFS
jgi:hypothetical protein